MSTKYICKTPLMSHMYCSFENKLEDFNMKKTRQTADGVFLCNVAVSQVFFINFWRAKSNLKYPLLRTCMMLMVDIHYFRFR